MVYLPIATFGCFLGQMLVNIPYMEHMGCSRVTVCELENHNVLIGKPTINHPFSIAMFVYQRICSIAMISSKTLLNCVQI